MVTAPLLELRSVSKAFGNLQALDSIDLQVEKGSLIVLLGPAGAGKTTLLRCISGLENIDSGEVRINGDDVTRWQPNQRDIAMIFDNLALYPNKNGYENAQNSAFRLNLQFYRVEQYKTQKKPKTFFERKIEKEIKNRLGNDFFLTFEKKIGRIQNCQIIMTRIYGKIKIVKISRK